jgi:hypothetical protein
VCVCVCVLYSTNSQKCKSTPSRDFIYRFCTRALTLENFCQFDHSVAVCVPMCPAHPPVEHGQLSFTGPTVVGDKVQEQATYYYYVLHTKKTPTAKNIPVATGPHLPGNLGGGRGSGPQHSVCRPPGSGQIQCTSWRNFAPFSSSTFKTIHGEQAGKRHRGGSAVGALEAHSARTSAVLSPGADASAVGALETHSARTPHNTTCIKQGYKTSARRLPLESLARGCSGSRFFCVPGHAVQGEARALHHLPVPALTLTMPCLSCSRSTLDPPSTT